MQELTQELLKEFTYYVDGALYWKPRNIIHFKTKRAYSTWNSRYAHSKIGTYNQGYLDCHWRGVIRSKVHRLVWLYHYGYLPNVIDHINGIRDDNHIENLRDVTISTNNKNMSISSSNTSGLSGVSFCNRDKLWRVQASINNRTTYIGCSKDFFEAVCLRMSTYNKLGFTERHGRNAKC